MDELFGYQGTGAAFLAARERGLLFDAPGLGKTPQAIKAIDLALANAMSSYANPDDHPVHVVVVCTASTVTHWHREIARWRKGDWSATVLSYDRLVRGGVWLPEHPDFVVLDEVHYCKNPDAKRTRAALKLAESATMAWGLTGTPAPNAPHELYTLLTVFAPPVLKGQNGKNASYLSFMKRYCETRPNPFGEYPKVVGVRNGPELKERLAPYMLRRTKKQVLKDLPPLVEANLYVDAAGPRVQQVWAMERELNAEQRRQMTAGEARALVDTPISTLRRFTGIAKAHAVADIVKDELGDGLEKIVLFAHHREVLDILEDDLKDFNPVRIDGSVPSHQRQALVDEFQVDDRCRVFVGQITAAGLGINLTAAQNVVFVEMSWVPSENEQAGLRIHRIGQTGSCLIRYAILPNSLDEQITNVLRRKMTGISQVFA